MRNADVRGGIRRTSSRFSSRWGVNLAIIVVGTLVALQIHGREIRIDSYRLDAAGRLVVMTSSGGALRWNRVASVEELDDRVTVTIRTAEPPVPMADIGVPTELIVPLAAPLGDRAMIDGSSEEPVPEAP